MIFCLKLSAGDDTGAETATGSAQSDQLASVNEKQHTVSGN